MTKRLLVTGSRTWDDWQTIEVVLRSAWAALSRNGEHRVVLVNGNANGADRLAARIWRMNGLSVETHPAQWRPYGIYNPFAGKARNQRMVDLGADRALAFLRAESSGTLDCIDRIRAAGIPLMVIRYGEEPWKR